MNDLDDKKEDNEEPGKDDSRRKNNKIHKIFWCYGAVSREEITLRNMLMEDIFKK